MIARALLAGQGLYYVASGLWPIFSMDGFEAVTGPKTDDWLVQTVGALAAVIGVALLAGARRERPARETWLLAALAATAFAAVDVCFFLRGEVGAIYLGDAAVEVVLAASALRGLFARGS